MRAGTPEEAYSIDFRGSQLKVEDCQIFGRRSGRDVRGMAMTSPCWTSQRSATWAAVLGASSPVIAPSTGVADHAAERHRAIGGGGEPVAAVGGW